MKAANDNVPQAASIRFPVTPRLVPLQKAARRLHLTAAEFKMKAVELNEHGFPSPCPITSHYDLKAIDAWLDSQSELLNTIGPAKTYGQARNASDVVMARLSNG